MSSFEKSVKGGTKIKLAAPKSKYVEHILVATNAGDAGVAEVFRTMTYRLRDSTWTIVFKALIITHLMIREGAPDVTLSFIADSPSKMAISNFSDAQVQGGNIRHYHNYILSRAKAFRDTKLDWVKEGKGRFKRLPIEKGLLRETESVQKQIASLLKCDLFAQDAENEISLTAFRLLTMDLMVLYQVMNEGTINVLEHYFEMSKPDAERSLAIYKTFSRQTDEVVSYLQIARQYEHATRLEIPKLKHAPTSLTGSLEEYLNDADFEINRRQYLAQKDGKKFSSAKNTSESSSSKLASANGFSSTAIPASNQTGARKESKTPAPDLIDFFASIEQNNQAFQTQPQPQMPQHQNQQSGFQGAQAQSNQQMRLESTNPFAQMAAQGQIQQPQQQQQQLMSQPNFTGFNQQQAPAIQSFQTGQVHNMPQIQEQSFQQQPFQSGQQQEQPQQQSFMTGQQQQIFTSGGPQPPPFSQQPLQASSTGPGQSTNPFRQSMMAQPTGMNSSPFNSPPPMPNLQQQSTNPFARGVAAQATGPGQNSSPFFSAPPTATNTLFSQQAMQPGPQTQPPAQPLTASKTGTNPFARSAPNSNVASPIIPQQTGTNPFRQSVFVNQQTGQGWQANQGTMGGLEQMPTVPVFPRPAGQQQQQPSPWQ